MMVIWGLMFILTMIIFFAVVGVVYLIIDIFKKGDDDEHKDG